MCFLVRHQQQAAAQLGEGTPPRASSDLRPRWVGVAGAALVGSLALAAVLTPAPQPPVETRAPASIGPVVTKASLIPAAATVDQRSLPADDGVPAATDTAKSAYGGCHHGM